MLRGLCLAFAIVVWLVGAVSAQPNEGFTSGQWRGWAHFKDGKFVRCATFARYINEWDLFFSVDDAGTFGLLLRSEKMLNNMLFGGDPVRARMRIDDAPLVVRVLTPLSEYLIETKFAANLDFARRFSTGKLLRVSTGRKVLRFPLTDPKEALVQLHTCANKHRSA